MDAPGAVVEDAVKLVGHRAAGAKASGVQVAFEAASVAEEVAGDAGAVTADRAPVGLPSRQQPVGTAAGTLASAVEGLGEAGAADRAVGPVRRLGCPPSAACAIADVPALVLLGGLVSRAQGSGRTRARLGRTVAARSVTLPPAVPVRRGAA